MTFTAFTNSSVLILKVCTINFVCLFIVGTQPLGGIQIFLLERVDKPVNGELDIEMGGWGVGGGGLPLFITVQFNHIYCV